MFTQAGIAHRDALSWKWFLVLVFLSRSIWIFHQPVLCISLVYTIVTELNDVQIHTILLIVNCSEKVNHTIDQLTYV